MVSFTTNNSSYKSRNYETIIDLYDKKLEKKIRENKDIDFTVDEIIRNLDIIDNKLEDSNGIEDDESLDLTDIQNMPLDKLLSDILGVETSEEIDESTTIKCNNSLSYNYNDETKEEILQQDILKKMIMQVMDYKETEKMIMIILILMKDKYKDLWNY